MSEPGVEWEEARHDDRRREHAARSVRTELLFARSAGLSAVSDGGLWHPPSTLASGTPCRREIRWFLPGDVVGEECHPEGAPDRRCDTYHLPSLLPSVSLKHRGSSDRLELKVRVGPVVLVEAFGVQGFAERWVKQRVAVWEGALDSPGWLPVEKEVWSYPRLEIARLHVAGEQPWTVCVEVRDDGIVFPASMGPWWPLLARHGTSASYSAWLRDASMPGPTTDEHPAPALITEILDRHADRRTA